jgi:outer membrane biosynthesis protein TonB
MNLIGTVKLEVLVSSSGVAKSIQVKGGNPLLAQAAQEALHSWRWEKADHETSEMLEFTFKPN